MDFYERLTILIKEKGLSQGKLEKELELSNGSISKWKKHTPAIDTTIKLANYFNVSVNYLMTGKEEDMPSPVNAIEHIDLITKYEKLSPSAKLVVMALLDELIKNNNIGE